MYREEILDHYKRPRNKGSMDTEIEAEGENTSCGDNTHIYFEVENGEILEIMHETEGCAICTAAVSILSEELTGKKVDEAESLERDWMLERLGVDISPMRMKCAMLGLKTAQKAFQKSEQF